MHPGLRFHALLLHYLRHINRKMDPSAFQLPFSPISGALQSWNPAKPAGLPKHKQSKPNPGCQTVK
jgi:hypothetical protein